MMQGTLSNPLVTIGVFIFTAIWWIVALGGISDAQSGANSASGALGYSGNAQLRFQWWQLWFEFFLLCGLGLVLATNRLQFFRAFFVTNFTIAAVLFMIGCDKFLQLRDASGGLGKFNTGCKVAFAGWIMLCIANLLLLWVLTLPLGEGGAHLDWTPGTTATNGTPAKGPKGIATNNPTYAAPGEAGAPSPGAVPRSPAASSPPVAPGTPNNV